MSEEQPQSRSGLTPHRPSGLPSRRDIIRARQEAAARERQAGQPPSATVPGLPNPKPGGPHRRSQAKVDGETAPAVPDDPVKTASAPERATPVGEAASQGTGTAAGIARDPLTTGVRSRRIEAERDRLRRRRRNAKIRTTLVLLFVIAVIVGCGYIAYNLLTKETAPTESADYPGPGSGTVEFVINPGDSGTTIGANLVSAGVVKTQEAFLSAWNDNVDSASIQPGTYQLKKQMRAVDAVAALLDDTRRSANAVTVVPGASVRDVSQRMKAFAKFKPEDVDAALADLKSLGLPEQAAGSLEGWLAPGTYEISSSDTPVAVLKRMVDNTRTTLDELKVPADKWHEVLTKASILEMEVNIDRYLPQVARVIENRLENPAGETAGFLNMDSTVNYGVGRSGGIPSSEDLQKDTPYNTYLHKGLPPTPIASPSKAAIEATLNPAPGDWLYFVTVDLDSGETKFAATKAEHDANIALLTKWCEEHKGKC